MKNTITFNQLKRLVESFDGDVDFITVRVDIKWDIDIGDGDEEENIKDEYDIPSSLYIKIPKSVWTNKSVDLDISGKLEDLYGFCISDFNITQVREPKYGAKVLYWNSYALEEW